MGRRERIHAGVPVHFLIDRIVINSGRIIILRTLIGLIYGIGTNGRITYFIRLRIFTNNQALFFTRGKDKGIKQIAQSKSIRHPRLVHIELETEPKRRHLRIIGCFLGTIPPKVGYIQRNGHINPFLINKNLFGLVINLEFRFNQPLKQAVIEHPRRCRIRGQGNFVFPLSHQLHLGQCLRRVRQIFTIEDFFVDNEAIAFVIIFQMTFERSA